MNGLQNTGVTGVFFPGVSTVVFILYDSDSGAKSCNFLLSLGDAQTPFISIQWELLH